MKQRYNQTSCCLTASKIFDSCKHASTISPKAKLARARVTQIMAIITTINSDFSITTVYNLKKHDLFIYKKFIQILVFLLNTLVTTTIF